MTTKDADAWEEKPAGFWIHWMAQCIDGVVLVSAGQVILLGIALIGILLLDQVIKVGPGDGIADVWAGFVALLFPVTAAAYFTLMTAASGQTLGKRSFNLKVVRLDGGPLSRSQALGRFLAHLVSGGLFFLGPLMAAFTPGKRALHDYIAGTRVVRVGPLGRSARIAAWVLPLVFLVLPIIVASIAIPGFSRVLKVSRQYATGGNWASIHSALALYKKDTGHWPAHLEDLARDGAYVDVISQDRITESNRVVEVFDGKGGWFYVPATGKLFLNLDGADLQGHLYCDYGQEKGF